MLRSMPESAILEIPLRERMSQNRAYISRKHRLYWPANIDYTTSRHDIERTSDRLRPPRRVRPRMSPRLRPATGSRPECRPLEHGVAHGCAALPRRERVTRHGVAAGHGVRCICEARQVSRAHRRGRATRHPRSRSPWRLHYRPPSRLALRQRSALPRSTFLGSPRTDAFSRIPPTRPTPPARKMEQRQSPGPPSLYQDLPPAA